MGDDGCPAVARTFRVFVSSTFADLKAERNALQERVFPGLQEFCLRHGGRFQAVDLRWGVSTEAGLDPQTITICLEEIRRCQETSPRPDFLVLLGDRYGWQPPPPQIPAEEFERILERVADPEDRALLPAWYLLDENAVPPVRYLRPRTGEWREDDTWSAVERRLRDVLEAPTPVTTDHLDQLCEDIYTDLLRIIREELRRLEVHGEAVEGITAEAMERWRARGGPELMKASREPGSTSGADLAEVALLRTYLQDEPSAAKAYLAERVRSLPPPQTAEEELAAEWLRQMTADVSAGDHEKKPAKRHWYQRRAKARS